MSAPVKVANVASLFASINRLAPNRDTSTDGWIGDYAHSLGVSGHNPDDTSGTRAEREDADSIPEVRAADVDKDLRKPGVTMTMVAETIRTTPNLRKRLIYIIWNRRIASASSGWAWRDYSGDNPHTEHLHASGHPDHDTNGSPWTEIERLGESMTLTNDQAAQLADVDKTLDGLDGRNAVGQIYTRMAMGEDHLMASQGVTYVPQHPSLKDLGASLNEIKAKLDAVASAMTAADRADVERDTDLRLALGEFQHNRISADELVAAIERRFSPEPSPVQSAAQVQ
jgi:hypothetical protein